MAALWLQSVSLLVLLVVLWPGSQAAPQAHAICGSDLVDALQYVCEDRGFRFSLERNVKTTGKRERTIVDECCHRPCTLEHIELYCM